MLLKNVKVIRPKTTKIQKRNGIGYVYQVIGKSYKKDKKYTVENYVTSMDEADSYVY